ncbi:MAG TPA: DUF2497 domain-containing protein [Rhizomicrobium sp.]
MSNPQHEPTMEEILASIRKIISEDTPSASQASAPNGEGEVLDLTQEVHEVAPSPGSESPANCHEHHDVRGLPQSAPASADDGDGLFSEQARAAAEETFSGFEPEDSAASKHHGAGAPVGESVQATFERAVREAFEPALEKWLANNSGTMLGHMKPVIRDWLDEHFPAMLETAVKNELARAARSRFRR